MTDGTVTLSDGCRIGWRMDGDPGNPLLLLSNSLGTNMAMWEPQVGALGERYRLLRYDSRGHGRSDAPAGHYSIGRLGQDVVELLDALDIGTAYFCGLSLGGMVGQWLGINEPWRIAKLVIANSSAHMGPASAWHDRIALVRKSGMTAIADAVTERWFTPDFQATCPQEIARIRTMLLETAPDGYCGSCAAIADMDLRDQLRRIGSQVLIIGGSFDPATPPEHTRLLSESIAGSIVHELPAAHLSNVELPTAFSNTVLRFLG